MKTKHNKKRNTAFIFEALVREMAKAIISKDKKTKNKLYDLMKEHFGQGSLLNRELQCYTALSEEGGFDKYTAEKMIYRAKEAYAKLNKKEIFQEQSKVISKINKEIKAPVFSNFVPNYKSFATISQIFNDKVSMKQKVIMEQQIVDLLCDEKNKNTQKMKPVDNLVVKSFIKNFNDQYTGLLPEQKKILSKYILAFGPNDADFRMYLKEELDRIHSEVRNSLQLEEVFSDERMAKNTQEVLKEIEQLNVVAIGKRELKKILKLQNLVNEYQDNANKD